MKASPKREMARYNEDCSTPGHGTHVAGIIGGTTFGVAKGVTLHSVRVVKCDLTSDSQNIIDGINWVAANHESPAIANMSLIRPANSGIDDAVRGMINQGVVGVAAAGNFSTNACNYSPAKVSEAITVGATLSNDWRRANSNYGSCVDLFAPGDSILSAAASNNSATAVIGGTSMAAAHVSGVAALYVAHLAQIAPVQPASVDGFIIRNASLNKVFDEGTGSPDRLLYSRWNKHWLWYNTENCYDMLGGSCYSQTWSPVCPSRPVWMKSCTTTGNFCWSIYSSTYVEEYMCSGTK
jgi:hypothetical protein